MKSLRFLLLAAVLVLSYAVSAAAAPVDCTKKIESFELVVDYSGSMMMKNAKLKKDKVLVAKDVLARINAAIPDETFTGGLHTMSPNGTLYAQGPWDREKMAKAIGKIKSGYSVFGRMTYMGTSLSKDEAFLSAMPRDAAIILISDGANNHGVDFVETARQVLATQRNLVIHIVSLADTAQGEANLKAVAAMNPESQYVRAEDLATSDAALEQFVIAVFCGKAESVIVLRGVNFAFDSYQLDAKAQGILNEAAEIIKANAGKDVLLTGWTDSKGSDAYNAKLSKNRANSVKTYLTTQGVPAARIKTMGKGKSFKYDNSTEEGRYMNRRTELSFN